MNQLQNKIDMENKFFANSQIRDLIYYCSKDNVLKDNVIRRIAIECAEEVQKIKENAFADMVASQIDFLGRNEKFREGYSAALEELQKILFKVDL